MCVLSGVLGVRGICKQSLLKCDAGVGFAFLSGGCWLVWKGSNVVAKNKSAEHVEMALD